MRVQSDVSVWRLIQATLLAGKRESKLRNAVDTDTEFQLLSVPGCRLEAQPRRIHEQTRRKATIKSTQ